MSKVITLPIELYPRQMDALTTRATELLFGGASEGGKSFFVRCALNILCSTINNLACFIYRKHYADVIGNHMDGPTGFRSMLQPWVKAGFVKITESEIFFTRTKALISLHGMMHDKDLEKHQGREKHVMVIDESTQILERHIKGLRGWVRMPKEMTDLLPTQLANLYPDVPPEDRKKLFPRIIYTANPIGISVGYFRRAFIAPRKPYVIERSEESGFLRQYIPSRIEDNPSADREAQRMRLKSLGDATADALITGNWNAPTGDFYPEYNDDLHCIPDFIPAGHLFKFRTFDWGSADPFCVHWWCVADSETMIGKRFIPRGALICYREWYGNNPEEPAKGIHMRNEDIAMGIVNRTHESMSGITLSDNFPFADRGGIKNGIKFTMADEFFENGCPLTLGNTARVYGYKQLRTRLQGIDGVPMIYFAESCRAARDYIPALPHHETKPEEAVESGEATHATDSCRLSAAARPWTYDAKPIPDPSKVAIITPRKILQQLQTKKAHFGGRN